MPSSVQTETSAEERYLSAFAQHTGRSLNGTNAAVRDRRQEAIERFRALGFPRKTEAYKYTNVARLFERDDYAIELTGAAPGVSPADIEPLLVPGLDAHRLVFVNGRFSDDLSDVGPLSGGAVACSFAQASAEHADLVDQHFAQYADFKEDALAALNTAFVQDGAFVHVPQGVAVEKPIFVLQLLSADAPRFLQPRHLYVAEENAQVQIVEHRAALSEAPALTNGVTECYVGTHAHVDHYVVQNEGPHASQVWTTDGYQDGESVFSTSTFTLSGDVVRNNLHLTPDAAHCESHLYGLYLGRGQMHVDNHTLVDHTMPDCFSNELYKGILNDDARGVFNGKVYVHRDAQRINAYQSNKNIVLTKTAEIFSKPELEIYADDVQCSHGSTTGQLDDEAVFYLRSRGIGLEKAREMLLHAFARDVLDTIRLAPLRDFVDDLVARRFG